MLWASQGLGQKDGSARQVGRVLLVRVTALVFAAFGAVERAGVAL
jgi:hypothetical protein